MRINSHRWQASLLLVLATLIGTSAFGSSQQRSSRTQVSGRTGCSLGIGDMKSSPSSGTHSIAGFPGTRKLVSTGDYHFEVEDSRADRQPPAAGSDLTPPTEPLSERFISGVRPVRRLGANAPFLSRSARARN
jgi:hypothetical protein